MDRDVAFVQVGDADCVGEVAPFPGLSRDSVGGGIAHLPVQLPVPRTVDHISELLQAVPAEYPATRFGLESALLRWLARDRGASVVSLLGDPRAVRLSALIVVGGLTDDQLTRAAKTCVAAGARTIKLKVPPSPVSCLVDAVEVLRRAVGPTVRVRLDLNRGLSTLDAREFLNAIVPFDVEFVEEPSVAPSALGRQGTPWALDESLSDLEIRTNMTSLGAAGIVLKPTFLGGVLACRALGREAAEAGLFVLVTHAFEGPLGQSHCAALASTLPHVRDCGLLSPGGGFEFHLRDLP